MLRVQQPAAGVLQTPLGRGALTTQGVRDVHDDNAFHSIFETQRTCTAAIYTHNDDRNLIVFSTKTAPKPALFWFRSLVLSYATIMYMYMRVLSSY